MFCVRKMLFLWSLVICVAFTQEGPFVYMSLVGTVATSENVFAELCE